MKSHFIASILTLMTFSPVYSENTSETLSEKWGTTKNDLGDKGLDVELVYTAEYFENFNGGIKEGGDYRGDVSLFVGLDTEEAGWWDKGQFFVHVQQQHGEGITERYVGDIQGVSNIDADHFLQISEFWYTHTFNDERAWLKVGKQDANEEFLTTEFGGEFLNSSPGTHPSAPIATSPDQDLGVMVSLEVKEDLRVLMGAYQARPDGGRSLGHALDSLRGPLYIVEPIIDYAIGDKAGQFHLGYWINNDDTKRLDASDSSDDLDGVYLTLDQVLLHDENSKPVIGASLQYAKNDDRYMEVDTFYGASFEWFGPVDGRDDDIVGLGIYQAKLSGDGGFEKDHETVYELFYKFQLNSWCSVKPDLQYIVNPGGSDNPDATVLGVRAEFSF